MISNSVETTAFAVRPDLRREIETTDVPEHWRYWWEKVRLEELESHTFAGGDMHLLASPNHFGREVSLAELEATVLEHESITRSLDTEVPIAQQLSEAQVDALISNRPFSFYASKIQTGAMTLAEIVHQVIPEGAKAAGIESRWFHPEKGMISEEVGTARAIAIGVRLIEQAVAEQGDLDGLIVSSSFLPENLAKDIVAAALELGILSQEPKVFDIRLFCAGSTAALAVALANPEFKDLKRVGVLSLEPLSYLLEPEHYSLDHFQIPLIFGDDYLLWLINPSEFELSPHSKIYPIFDQGVIKIQTWYEMETLGGELEPWLEELLVLPEGENVLDISSAGIFMAVVDPLERTVEMDGMATARFFSTVSPKLIQETLEAQKRAGLPVEFVFNHPPSGAVVARIQKFLNRLELGVELRFDGKSNASSATVMRQIGDLLEDGKLDENAFVYPTLVFAPGIGAVFALVVMYKKKFRPEKNRETTIFSAADND